MPRWVWPIAAAIGVAGVAIALAIVVTSGDNPNTSDEPPPPKTFQLVATLSAPECGGGYNIENAAVDIRDQNDKLIGAASTGIDEAGPGCKVSFAVAVPKASFYQIKIGTHSGPSYSFDELQSMNFHVDLSLGD